jgi:hypothetical protein
MEITMKHFAILSAACILVTSQAHAAGCGDGLVMLERTLPYAELTINDRKVAHNMLVKARNENSQGRERECRLIAGEIVKLFILKQPEGTPDRPRIVAESELNF